MKTFHGKPLEVKLEQEQEQQQQEQLSNFKDRLLRSRGQKMKINSKNAKNMQSNLIFRQHYKVG